MKEISNKERRRLIRQGKIEGSKPVKKELAPEDKQLKVIAELLAVVKETNTKTDKMSNLNLSMANTFLQAMDKIKAESKVESNNKKEWMLTPVRAKDGLIKYITVKEVK